MKIISPCARAMLLIAVLTQSAVSQKLPSEARGASISQVVMLSVNNRGCAAGIVVGYDAKTIYVATAEHIITDPKAYETPPVSVKFYGLGGTRQGRFFPKREEKDAGDLAVVLIDRDEAVNKVLDELNFAMLPPVDSLPLNAPVTSIGCFGGTHWTLGSQETLLARDRGYLHVQSNVNEGQSGGGLFSEAWELIGMPLDVGVNQISARPIGAVLNDLRTWGVPVLLTTRPLRDRVMGAEELARRLRILDIERSLLDNALGAVSDSTSRSDLKRGEFDERNLLLVRQAYNFDKQYGAGLTGEVDSAFSRLLTIVPFRIRISNLKPPVQAVTFSPDGKFMAICARGASRLSSTVQIWSVGRNIPPREVKFDREVLEAAFDPLGRWLAVVGDSPDLVLINLQDRDLHTVRVPLRSEPILSVAISSDGLVATGASDGTILLHQIRHLDLPPKSFKAEASVESLAFGGTGKWLASMTSTPIVTLWSVGESRVAPVVMDTSNKLNHQFFEWGPHELTWGVPQHPMLTFSRDGSMLAANILPNIVRIWSVGAGYPYRDAELKKTGDDTLSMQLSSLAFSPDGKTLALGAWTVFGVDLTKPNAAPTELLSLEANQISHLAYNADGRLGVAYEDGVDIWKLEPGAQGPTVLEPAKPQEPWQSPESVVDDQVLQISPDGSQVLSAGWGLALNVWNLATKQPASVLKRDDIFGQFACFIEGGDVLIPGTETLFTYSPVKGSIVSRKLSGYASAQAIGCDENGTSVVTASDGDLETIIRVWDKADGSVEPWIIHLPAGDEHEARTVTSIAVSRAGDFLAIGTIDGNVRFWDMRKRDPNPSLAIKQGQRVTTVAFSSDGMWLASAGTDGTIQLHQTTSPNAAPLYLRGHEGAVTGLSYEGRGHRLASGGADGTVRLWDTDHPEYHPIIRTSPFGKVTGVALRRDGKVLIAGVSDRRLISWDISTDALAKTACGSVIRNLTVEEWSRFIASDLRYEQTCPGSEQK